MWGLEVSGLDMRICSVFLRKIVWAEVYGLDGWTVRNGGNLCRSFDSGVENPTPTLRMTHSGGDLRTQMRVTQKQAA